MINGLQSVCLWPLNPDIKRECYNHNCLSLYLLKNAFLCCFVVFFEKETLPAESLSRSAAREIVSPATIVSLKSPFPAHVEAFVDFQQIIRKYTSKSILAHVCFQLVHSLEISETVPLSLCWRDMTTQKNSRLEKIEKSINDSEDRNRQINDCSRSPVDAAQLLQKAIIRDSYSKCVIWEISSRLSSRSSCFVLSANIIYFPP